MISSVLRRHSPAVICTSEERFLYCLSDLQPCLGLKPGQVLDFDENTAYLKAVPVFDEQAMRALVGCTRGNLKKTTDEWLNETRGPVIDEER